MTLRGQALRMTVFISQDDRFHHHPLYTEIVHRAHAAGLAGATVLRGYEGFGATSRVHTSRMLSLAEDLPAVIILVDTPERIRAFLPQVQELVVAGLITLDEVEVAAYVSPARHRRRWPVADGEAIGTPGHLGWRRPLPGLKHG